MNLTDYVKEVSRQDFGIEFQHTASWNSRLQQQADAFSPKMDIWILILNSAKRVMQELFEKLFVMNFVITISIMQVKVIDMAIRILKICCCKSMECVMHQVYKAILFITITNVNRVVKFIKEKDE